MRRRLRGLEWEEVKRVGVGGDQKDWSWEEVKRVIAGRRLQGLELGGG